MDKFGRNYSLTVTVDDEGDTITITPPFTLELDTTQNILTSLNICRLRIYNLSENTRNKIRYNFYNMGQNWPVILNAGYGTGDLPEIFVGNMTKAWTAREGSTFVTTIECMDTGYAFQNAVSGTAFPAGTPMRDVILSLITDMAPFGVSVGAVGAFPGSLLRGNTYSGPTATLLNQITNGGFYTDGGKAFCLGNNECVPAGSVSVINADSGLLNTPALEQTVLSVEMLFEPGIVMGQKIQLLSSTDKFYNNFYKVVAIKHRGMISDAVCGDLVTSLQMFFGSAALDTIAGVL